MLNVIAYSIFDQNTFSAEPDTFNIKIDIDECESDSQSSTIMACPKSSEPTFSWEQVECKDYAYSLNGILGEGVSSIVYEATHPIHGVCAVKVMRDNHTAFAEDEIAFLKKVQGHANMLKVLDTWETDGVWHIAMEKLEGSLDDLIGSLNSDEVLDFARQLTSSVMYLHYIGIVHFDLKPSNIGYTYGPNGIIYKILDLGISEWRSHVDSLEFKESLQSGDLQKVSLWYRPIEAFSQPERMTEKTDVWSIGCILFELMNGYALFDKLDDVQSMAYNQKVFEDGKTAVHYLFLNTDEKVRLVAQLILDCLEFNPDARIGSALAWWNLIM
jgi:serine/threonine protein kinase